MEAVAEGLWGLADHHEDQGEIAKAIKCLEAVCQSQVPFLPIIEVKTRLRVAVLLLKHSHNVNHAKAHLERAQVLLNKMPSCFELKCRAYSLLSQCYHLVGAVPSQKHILGKALELTATSGDGFTGRLWFCNFNSQKANALIVEGNYQESITALEHGFICATKMCYQELQMYFAASILHVHLMQWIDVNLVEGAVNRCKLIWESFSPDKVGSWILWIPVHHLFLLYSPSNFKYLPYIPVKVQYLSNL
ncbi:OLC1v1006495C3 [Oldenlandia corymbosa var. corymbosa]|uniref:OLC1v1006495C3 n=1 Tax=Oldenlandia corymbosa var. corymbosa TaxID=529605 RepID=A0AAV1DIM4_OLDCO|nr:OLC1v1006495C3 [Oldenlandia corymbosa var. corymbosa]